jgi:MFS family permease
VGAAPTTRRTPWKAGPSAPAGLFPAALLVSLNLVDGLEANLVGGALPLLQDEWGFSDTLAGAIPTAASISGLLVTLPAGYLADRHRRTRLLAAVVTSWAVLSTASALATGFWMFFVIRVVLGSANSLDNPSASSLIADLHPPASRSRVFAAQRAAWTVGASVGIALGGLLGEALGWRAPFLLMAVPGLVVGWLLFRLPEPRRGQLDGPPAAGEAAPADSAAPPGTVRFAEQLRSLWRVRTLRAVYTGAAVAYLGFNGLAYWAPSFFEREHGLGEGTGAALTGVIGVVATVAGSATGGVLGDRWGGIHVQRRVLLAGLGLTAGGAALVVGFAISMLVPQLLLLVLGASAVVSAAPNLAAVIADLLPPDRRGIGYAMFTFVIAAGGALGPLLVGILSDVTGSLQLAFVLGFLPVLPGGLLVVRAHRRAVLERAGSHA